MKSVAVFFATGFEEIEAITIVDVLRRAAVDVSMVSVTDRRMVAGSHDITVLADKVFIEVDFSKVDMIVLPGGMPGAASLNDHEKLKQQLVKFNVANKPIGAICAAPMILGGLDLLKGKQAVCYPGFEKFLVGADVLDQKVVASGNIITARGPGTAIDFGLKIVEHLLGSELAEQLRKAMIAD